MNLSPHFTLEEMTRSVAHPDIPNIPNPDHIAAMGLLCANVLEKIREHFGKPMTVLSGFRSPELNKAVGGASTSQHLTGCAADIEIYGIPNDDLYRFIVANIDFDQCIAEKLSESDGSAGWVHVSHVFQNNRKDAISFLGNGVYVKGLQYAS